MSRLEAALRRAQSTTPATPATAAPQPATEQRIARAVASLMTHAPIDEPRTPVAGIPEDGEVAEKLVVRNELDQSTVEQYRKLAATLHHAQTEKHLNVVMVSSAVPGDGKTLTSTNLALTLSESYHRRVLLIDADLRRPSVHRVFQLKNAGGLSECLTAETERRLPL